MMFQMDCWKGQFIFEPFVIGSRWIPIYIADECEHKSHAFARAFKYIFLLFFINLNICQRVSMAWTIYVEEKVKQHMKE